MLEHADHPADIRLHFGARSAWPPIELAHSEWRYVSESRGEHGEPTLTVRNLAGGRDFLLRYVDGTEFLVLRSGAEVWVAWSDELTLADAATYLLGPVLGFVLLLRGNHSLHASAMAVGEQAVAFVGAAGAGKSTLAAAFARRGHRFLSDDVVALEDRGQSFRVRPAPTVIRLWPESVSALFGHPDALPRLTPTWDKRGLDLTSDGYHYSTEALPLAAIYLLGERSAEPSAPFVEAVPAQERKIALIRETYTTYLMDAPMRAREFELLGRVATKVPIRRLRQHVDIARLPQTCDAVLADFESLSSSNDGFPAGCLAARA